LLNEVGSFFGILKYVCGIVVKKFTFAVSSPDEFLLEQSCQNVWLDQIWRYVWFRL